MRKSIIVIIGLILIGLLSACGETTYEPVDISQDTDQCYTCHMGVEDLQSATQIILEDGTPRIFDDIGCMLTYLRDNNDQIAVSYVIDHDSGEWVDLNEATFVHDQEVQTPMSYGFIAFGSEQGADAYVEANGHGEKLTAEELQQIDANALEDWYRGHEAGHHGHGEHDEDVEV